MKRSSLTVLLLTILLALSCSQMDYMLRQQGYLGLKRPWIRVRVTQSDASITVDAKGAFVVRTWDINGERSAYYSASPVVVKAGAGALDLFDQKGNLLEQRLRKVTMLSEQKSWLYLNGRMFRGVFEFFPLSRDTFYTVNVLNVEDYLKGVLQPEIGNRTENEFEAVKAQAVAARTYAFVTQNKYPDREYDLINDIVDQVYTGVTGEQAITSRAVKVTKGEVLTYGGNLIDAYYHSTCAGRTDNIEDVWDKDPRPYLVGVTDDDFCSWSKYYTWTETFPVTVFLEHVRSYLRTTKGEVAKIGNQLAEIVVIDRTSGGRARSVKVVTNGGTVVLRKDQIRWAFGRQSKPGILPSSNFSAVLVPGANGAVEQVQISGSGYGHGIGMCQCGAIGMARAGYLYDQILTHYYSGVTIEKLY